MKFNKVNITSTKGVQKSVWDDLLPEFINPGDSLEFDEKKPDGNRGWDNPDGLTRPAAAQAAKRLSLLSGKRFHSFFNNLNKKVTVRLRLDGEVPDKNEEEESTDSEQLNEGNFDLG